MAAAAALASPLALAQEPIRLIVPYAPGGPLDITIAVDGETVASAVMDRGRDRTVIHAGRVVADGLQLV